MVCCRSIVILESNLGQSQLHKMLVQAGDRTQVIKPCVSNRLHCVAVHAALHTSDDLVQLLVKVVVV